MRASHGNEVWKGRPRPTSRAPCGVCRWARRRREELLIVEMAPPEDKAPQLLPLGISGLHASRPGGLTSPTTRHLGLVAGIDLAPTALRWLHVPVPADMRGLPIVVSGPRDAGGLKAFSQRITEIGKYRLITAEGMMLLWLALVLALGALRGGWDGSLRRGLRLGSLAFMWAPTFVLLEAAAAPASSGTGLALIAVPSFVAGWLTDRRFPWPRGPIAPMASALLVYTVDL